VLKYKMKKILSILIISIFLLGIVSAGFMMHPQKRLRFHIKNDFNTHARIDRFRMSSMLLNHHLINQRRFNHLKLKKRMDLNKYFTTNSQGITRFSNE